MNTDEGNMLSKTARDTDVATDSNSEDVLAQDQTNIEGDPASETASPQARPTAFDETIHDPRRTPRAKQASISKDDDDEGQRTPRASALDILGGYGSEESGQRTPRASSAALAGTSAPSNTDNRVSQSHTVSSPITSGANVTEQTNGTSSLPRDIYSSFPPVPVSVHRRI